MALDPMCDVLERVGMAVNLAVLTGPDIQWIDKIGGTDGARIGSRVGARFPASCSALGKALLAFGDGAETQQVIRQPSRVTPYSIAAPSLLADDLAMVRERGYAVEREESAFGITCLAAPVHHGGRVVAAMSVLRDGAVRRSHRCRISSSSAGNPQRQNRVESLTYPG